ncbi:copper resistance CopC family protein [Micromonospora sp. RP3T]|uniref:copper resistance CopC family protein n=1 Tax=Micromonospora sp. RP3T TaxID=2135446 RepID=UPI000D1510C6|nr:copper resistance CopC family protein [Micromonospora sp. RP3T]PTA45561.1 copper resistance protein CopC [Micromonospora sp. RP3T]
MRTRSAAVVALVFAALLLPATPASAHNALQTATPAQDARLTTAPTSVTLRFIQQLNPEFTTIVLSDADRRKVPTGAPAVGGTTGTITVDQPLPNGTYTVAYRVVSADGHPVQGSYRFTVADPTTGSTAPDAAGTARGDTAASPAATTGGADDGPPVVPLAAGAVAGLAVLGAFALLTRRRRAS